MSKTVKLTIRKKATWIDSIRGLMFVKDIENTLIKTWFGIHTFFVREEIDVVITDKRFCVQIIKESLARNRIYTWYPFFTNVLEMPKGSIKKFKIKHGDQLDISLKKEN